MSTFISKSTLRPGLIVSVKTAVTGNVKYSKADLGVRVTDEGEQHAKWETERVIADPEENARAGKVRSKCRSLIGMVCAPTAFGMMCPESKEDLLRAAAEEASKIADEFNSTAKITRVSFAIMTGRIAPDDEAAVKAINREARELLEDMKRGLETLDVKAVRDTANRARHLAKMLQPEPAARIQVGIDAARACANRMAQAGDTMAKELDKQTLQALTESRTAFLDISEKETVTAPKPAARSIDLGAGKIGKIKREKGGPKLKLVGG